MRRRTAALVLAPVCGLLVVGCGGSGDNAGTGSGSRPRGAAAAAPGRFLHPAELRTQLANGMHAGLYRLAVISQKGDDSVDLGQSLPTGTVDDVACRARGERPRSGAWGWSCSVDWRTAGGAARGTSYAVRMTPKGCFSASARPSLPSRYDSTIRSYSADPLDQLASTRSGC